VEAQRRRQDAEVAAGGLPGGPERVGARLEAEVAAPPGFVSEVDL
jgi:hypothetical protein